MSNIFDNAPKWETVKTTDNSNILDSITKAYTSQKQSFDELQTAWKDFATNAQKAHQQESINALNNMSVDELTAVDVNTGQTAKEKFLADFAKRGEAIGGYNNQTAIDVIYDQRINSAIADESAMRVRDEAVRGDEVNAVMTQLTPLLVTSNNSNDVFGADVQNANQKELERVATHFLDPNSNEPAHVKAAVINALNENGHNRLVEGVKFLNQQATRDEAEYKAKYAPMFNSYFDNVAKATAILEVGRQIGDATLVTQAENTLKSLKAYEAVDDPAKGTTAGLLTLNYNNMSEGARRYLDANRNSIQQAMTDNYRKHYSELARLGIDVAKLELARDTYKLDKSIAENGTWKQQRDVEIANDSNTIRANEVEGRNGSKPPTLSLTGNPVIEGWYSDMGISTPVIQNRAGEFVVNKTAINDALNSRIQQIRNPDVSGLEKAINDMPYSHGSDWFSSGSRLNHMMNKLNSYETTNKDGTKRLLTHSEKIIIAHKFLSTQGADSDAIGTTPDKTAIERELKQIHRGWDAQVTAELNNWSNYLAQDMQIPAAGVANEMGWYNDATLSALLPKHFSGRNAAPPKQTTDLVGRAVSNITMRNPNNSTALTRPAFMQKGSYSNSISAILNR